MKYSTWLTDNLFQKLVALLLSLLLWGGVAAGRNGSIKLAVPLKIANLAADLTVRGALPTQIEIDVVGPRILLFQLRREQLSITLDFSGVAGGVIAFDHLGRGVDLNPGLEVIRTTPGRLQVWVEPAVGKQVQH